MSTSKVVLILGSGPNIGLHTSRAFAAQGYKVALASRSAKPDPNNPDATPFQVDLSSPSSVPVLFTRVKEALGIPSVVIYNAAAATLNSPTNPFSLSVNEFAQDLNINTVSVYVAAQQASLSFAELGDSAAKTFIYTGNVLNEKITLAPMMSLGIGKSATAHLIHSASVTFKDQGHRFFYVDERKSDGSPAYRNISGEGHAKHFLDLVEGKDQGPWQQTFVSGEGYKEFSGVKL